MSALFRTLAAATKTISQALAFAGVLVLVIVIYTGSVGVFRGRFSHTNTIFQFRHSS